MTAKSSRLLAKCIATDICRKNSDDLAILKWGTLALVVLAAILTFTGRKTFHVEIFVPAPPEAIWTALTDANAYAEWNPVFVNVKGKFHPGTTVQTTVLQPGKPEIVISSEVRKVVPNKELNQFGGISGIITFDHQWLLEPAEGGTKVIQHEVDRGIYVWFWDSDWVEPSYLKASEALRDRVLSRS